MTIRELESRMGAAEFMEWAAYFKAADPEESERIREEIKSDEQRAAQLKAFFSTLRGR